MQPRLAEPARRLVRGRPHAGGHLRLQCRIAPVEPEQEISIIRRAGGHSEVAAAVAVDDIFGYGAAFAEGYACGGVFEEGRFAGEVAGDGFEGFGGEHWGAGVEVQFVGDGELFAEEDYAFGLGDA